MVKYDLYLTDIPERKEKRYKEVALATEKILNLLNESQRLFRADENSEAWWDYLVTMARFKIFHQIYDRA